MRSKSLGTRVGPLTRIPWGAFQILKSHLGGLGIRILFKVPNVVGPSGVARYTGSWRIASSRIKFTCVCCCSPDRSRRRRVVGEVESCYVDEDEGGALVRPLRFGRRLLCPTSTSLLSQALQRHGSSTTNYSDAARPLQSCTPPKDSSNLEHTSSRPSGSCATSRATSTSYAGDYSSNLEHEFRI